MSATDKSNHDFQDVQVSSTRGILPIIWQRKELVILGILLGLGGGFLVYWQRPPVYQSNALVLVIKKNSQPLPIANEVGRQYYEDYMATHVVLLRSPMIIEKAVKKKDLASLRTFEGSGDAAGIILNSLSVSRDVKELSGGTNNIVYIVYRGPVAEDCGKILTAIIESYQEFLDIAYRNVSDQHLEGIAKARDTLKGDLKRAEDEYREFRTKRMPLVFFTKDGGNLTLDRMAEIERKRSGHIIRMEELKERIKSLDAAIKSGKGSDTLIALLRAGETKAVVNNQEKTLSEKLLPLRAEEGKLLQSLDQDHPSVKEVRAHMAMIEKHHKEFEGRDEKTGEKNPAKDYLAYMRAELKDVEVVFNSLGGLLDQLKLEAKAMSTDELQEEHLRSEVKRFKEFYELMVKRLSEVNLMRDGGFEASPLAHSGVGVKVAPSAFQNMMGGLMLGLLAGIGLAFLADFTDKGFRNPDEVRRRLQLPLLGHVPFLRADAETAQKIEAGDIQTDPLLQTLYHPKSLESEAYRAIRTALLFTIQSEGHRVVQVTSPSKGDGKSLLISNLAISVAQSDKRVLVIDADCRRPRQHKIFHVSNNQGLVNIIRQEETWENCVQQAADGLWVLPSGPVPHNPAELLASPQFQQLLAKMPQEFDLVLVDSPPLLAVTDPCIVAGKVDGVVLTIRLSRQGRPQAERACEIMKSLHVNVFGVVVNGVTRHVGGGLYSSEHYDYTESYTENENTEPEDGYYYQQDTDETGGAPAAAPSPAAVADGKKPSLLSRMFPPKK